MSLKKYLQKRDLAKTPEPGAEEKISGGYSFVIQKHDARHLHYDFRLEVGGVLKSWAVPKGPPFSNDDKRLAMMVEDHPYDYKDFEGVIPKGNYGAGTVMVWDQGTYRWLDENAGYAKKLKEGKLTVILRGKKLKGEFALVRLKRANERNAWLLIKSKKEPDIKPKKGFDKSVLTGRTTEEIANSLPPKKEGLISKILRKASPGKWLDTISPMKAQIHEKPFDHKDWVFEIKYDGYRIITKIKKGKVNLFLRGGKNFNRQLKEVHDSLAKMKINAVLDGEVVALDRKGNMSFQALQNYLKGEKNSLIYYVFDVLYYAGRDLTKLPLIERKKILKYILPDLANVKYADHVEESGKKFYQLALKEGLEGIVAKVKDSQYYPGKRSSRWLKIKTHNQQEVVIVGYTEPRGERKDFGALIMGVYSKNKLRYVGHVGTGFTQKNLREIKSLLAPQITKRSPFNNPPETNAPATWVKPKMIAEVSFLEWTEDGVMRQPVFMGIREDKRPREAHREKISHLARNSKRVDPSTSPKKASPGTTEGAEFKNLDKIFWPKEGYTKGNLIDYYDRMADVILPYLKDRPESLNRHPDGIEGKSFYQKDFTYHAKKWLKTKKIYSESEGKEINYLLCQNKKTLLYLANLGCIEINPWSSRISRLEHPDFLILDIDPGDVPWKSVIKTVLTIKKVLDEIKIKSYIKTSGATGLHIYVPLGAKYNYDQSKDLAKLIGILVNKRLPDITSLERNPKKRKRKIYLDFLQNREGQTLAAPYSLRPRPSAPVSTPLKWEEVNSKLDPLKFNIRTIEKRLKKVGDLWQPVLRKGIEMEKALEKITALVNKKKKD